MRLLLRVLGTRLIGMALILLIIDGTRSLGASALVWTPLHDTWASIHPDSLAAVREFVATRFFGPVLGPVLEGILGLPGFIVLAVPGVLLALMGAVAAHARLRAPGSVLEPREDSAVFFLKRKPAVPPDIREPLPGRATEIATAEHHFISGNPLKGPYPPGSATAYFGLGCFWGAERLFWKLPGVFATAAGYQGGVTPNPTYDEVCTGDTGHAEVVRVVYQPAEIGFGNLLKVFWEGHDPTQGMRQGNDTGTQYRSAIYTTTAEQAAMAKASRADFARALKARGHGPITTEIGPAGQFYHAESYHQQYLGKNPMGYCGLEGTGVACPLPTPDAAVRG